MADELERPDRLFEEAQTFARTYRFEMTDEYRALIERVEAIGGSCAAAPLKDARNSRTAS